MPDDLEVRLNHDWTAIVTYDLSEADAEMASKGVPVVLGAENQRDTAGPLCFRCETPYGEHDPSCPGEPEEVPLHGTS